MALNTAKMVLEQQILVNTKCRFMRSQTTQRRCLLQQREREGGLGFGLQLNVSQLCYLISLVGLQCNGLGEKISAILKSLSNSDRCMLFIDWNSAGFSRSAGRLMRANVL